MYRSKQTRSASIAADLQRQGARVPEAGLRAFALPLRGVPAGYSRMVAAVTGETLYLYATDDSGNDLRILDTMKGALINSVKVEVSSDDRQIQAWSQAPFRAFERRAVINWDGRQMTLVSVSDADPTAEYFHQGLQLVGQGDLEGLMRTANPGVLYPGFYRAGFVLARETARLAYDRALQAYRAGNLTDALRFAEFAVEQYTRTYGDLLTDSPYGAEFKEEQLPRDEQERLLNDYAFFVAEAGKPQQAEPLLLRVVKAAPSRAVAHLNLGDVEWSLGKTGDARQYYRKCLDLLGSDRSVAPQRVLDRLK